MTPPDLSVSLDKLAQHHKELLALYAKLPGDRAIRHDLPLSQLDFGQLPSGGQVARSWNEAIAARAREAEEIRDVIRYVTNSLDEIRDLYAATDQEAARDLHNIPEGAD